MTEASQLDLTGKRNAHRVCQIFKEAVINENVNSRSLTTLREKNTYCVCCGEQIGPDHGLDVYDQIVHDHCVKEYEQERALTQQQRLINPDYVDQNKLYIEICKAETNIPQGVDAGWYIHPNGISHLTEPYSCVGWRYFQNVPNCNNL